jgi:hypothetical protein
MKTWLTFLVAVLALYDLHGQGRVIFNTIGAGVNAPATNFLTLQRVEGIDFLAQLFYGPVGTDENALISVTNPPAHFGTGGLRGYIDSASGGGIRVLDGISEGAPAVVQVRAWDASLGADYATAYQNWLTSDGTKVLGRSKFAQLTAGTSTSATPLTVLNPGFFLFPFPPVPDLQINDIVVSEGTNGTKDAIFTVTMFAPSTNTVSVDYLTADGSAMAGSDYIAASGTLTFAAGETRKTIVVTLTADLPPEPDEVFSVKLTNAVNALIRKAEGTCTITEVRITGISVDTVVTFNTVSGRRYVAEKSDDMVHWTPIIGGEDVPGTGSPVTVIDRGGGCQPSRLYRARLLD